MHVFTALCVCVRVRGGGGGVLQKTVKRTSLQGEIVDSGWKQITELITTTDTLL